MNNSSQDADRLLVERIRSGDAGAWEQLIALYEGRLLAFAQSRLGRRSFAEDVVQEAFVGFLTSLPNFDPTRRLESYLFSICAHKLTDHMRREGRRPALPFSATQASGSESLHFPAAGRGPSTIVRQGERRELEEDSLADALKSNVARWQKQGNWTKLKCIELLFVRGWANKKVAEDLKITEQQVANYKSDFLGSIRKAVRKQELPSDVFPELHEG
jgi:RNA polymerase sigma-70 factor (ECF subfamily)